MPFLSAVGMVILAGKLVIRAVGAAIFVPVSVNSRLVPRCIPMGNGMSITGASGLGGIGAGVF